MQNIGEKYGHGKFAGDGVDLTNWKAPQRLRTTEDGDQVIEKIPSLLHVKMLSPNGNTVFVPLANGMGPVSQSDPYRIRSVVAKQNAGFLPYGKCPKAAGLQQHLPKAMQESSPCKLAEDGHAISSEHPCKCITEIQKLRQGKQLKAMNEVENRHRTKEMRESAQREAQIDKQSQVIEKLAEAVEGLSVKQKTDKDKK